jgi:hypothetical protein
MNNNYTLLLAIITIQIKQQKTILEQEVWQVHPIMINKQLLAFHPDLINLISKLQGQDQELIIYLKKIMCRENK